MTFIILKYGLLILAGIANAFMDTSADHFDVSILKDWDNQYWDRALSWRNKYRRPKWIIVELTDGWHLCKGIMIYSICIAAAFPTPGIATVWDIVLCRLAFGVGFYLFYNWILIKKK